MAGDERTNDESPRARILVVDDNQDNLDVLATRLRFRGYEVDTATKARRRSSGSSETRRI